MKIGDTITYLAESGQVFPGGATSAPAVVQGIDEDGKAHVLVAPEGGEPFTALVPPAPSA